MADEQSLTSDARISTNRESVEVIHDGKPLSGSKNLESIFDQIESGKSADEAIKETMSSKPVTEPPPEPEAKPEVVPEPKEEPKPEKKEKVAKNLDEAFTKQEEANAPIPEVKPEAEVSEEELTVLPHDKPKTAKRIQALLTKISKADATVAETKKDAELKATELKKLQDQLASVQTVDPRTQEEVKKQLEELAQYRRRYELEKDPEVQSRYDSKISGADVSISKILGSRGAGEALLKTIADDGGWAKFADSNQTISVKGEAEPITHAELAARILKSLPYSEQRAIDTAVNESIQAKKDKDRYFEDEGKKATEYFSKREEAAKQQQEASVKQQAEARQTVDQFHADLMKNNDFLQIKEIPANATKEQKAKIEEDNTWAKQIDAERQKMVQSKTLPEILAVVEQAVKYHNERHVNARLTAQLKAKTEELERYKAAGKTTARSGSISGGAPASSTPAKPKQAASLEEAFSRMEAGDKDDE